MLALACAHRPPPPVPIRGDRSPYDHDAGLPDGGVPHDPVRLATALGLDQDLDPLVANAVFGQMAADPRFRVCEWHHAIVAFLRDDGPAGPTVTRDGINGGSDRAHRVLWRFTAWDADDPHTVQRFENPGLALEIWQGADDPKLASDALNLTAQVVKAVLADAPHVEAEGYIAAALPVGEPANGAASLTLAPTGPGEIEVRARVNPGGPGWSWVRIVRGGNVWEEQAVGVGSREAIGWSANPIDKFLLQGRFFVPTGPGFRARGQIWFQAAGSTEAMELLDQPIRVPER